MSLVVKQNIYLLSLFLYNLARVLPHAILTVILLNKGMDISQIAVIQSFYMIAAIMFEFPSGILTDILSEKLMYEISIILIMVSYFFTWWTDNYLLLCVSWFIYGMSAASMSGSLDAYFVRSATNDDEIKKFNVLMNNSVLYSGLIGGGLGSLIFNIININLYIISISIFLGSLLLIAFGFKIDANSNESNTKSRASLNKVFLEVKQIRTHKRLLKPIILLAIFQIMTQLFYQFWQISFLEQSISKKYFGIFYILFQLIAIIGNFMFSKFEFENRHILLITTMSIMFLLSVIIHSKVIFLFAIFIFLIPFNIYNSQLNIDIQKTADEKIIASIISLSGTISSIISVVVLWIIGSLDNYFGFRGLECLLVISFFILSLITLVFFRKSNASINE